MISIVGRGQYRLVEITREIKILILDTKDFFIWEKNRESEEILERYHQIAEEGYVLAEGNYRLYHVGKENHLTDEAHLELYVGNGRWQGYLLPNGFPDIKDSIGKKYPIIPTKELITKVMMNEYQGSAWL